MNPPENERCHTCQYEADRSPSQIACQRHIHLTAWIWYDAWCPAWRPKDTPAEKAAEKAANTIWRWLDLNKVVLPTMDRGWFQKTIQQAIDEALKEVKDGSS